MPCGVVHGLLLEGRPALGARVAVFRGAVHTEEVRARRHERHACDGGAHVAAAAVPQHDLDAGQRVAGGHHVGVRCRAVRDGVAEGLGDDLECLQHVLRVWLHKPQHGHLTVRSHHSTAME